MSTEVIMPQMGESIAEGTVTKWYKKVGDTVERDEPLFEISTDKVDTEIPSPVDGVLSEIRVGEGETVPIDTVVGVIGGDRAAASDGPEPKGVPTGVVQAAASVRPEPQNDVVAGASPRPNGEPRISEAAPRTRERAPIGQQGAVAEPASANDAPRSSPLVRKMAEEHGIDLRTLSGTGRDGRISKQDILAFLEGRQSKAPTAAPQAATAVRQQDLAPPPAATSVSTSVGEGGPQAPPTSPTPQISPRSAELAVPLASAASGSGRTDVVPLSSMRRSIAEHMVMSRKTSAHVTTVFEVDVSRIVQTREAAKARFLEDEGVKLTYTPFFIRAVLGALKSFPELNASLVGNEIVFHREHNIGVAVALDGGLIVPVVHHADEKSFLGLARAVADVATRARNKKLLPNEVQGGTFTITNPGPFGGLFGTPIINQPQVAILGVGGIHKRPVVVGDAIAVRSMVYLALSFDHRLIDGALGDQFMADVKRRLEAWDETV